MAIEKKIIMNSNWKSIGQIIEEIDFDDLKYSGWETNQFHVDNKLFMSYRRVVT